MPTPHYSYHGLAYRQGTSTDAPWLVSFVASANEVLHWAGIPRRTNDDVSGFQRASDPNRVNQTKEFFEHGLNQSPTALVVGIHEPAEGNAESVRLEWPNGLPPETAMLWPCELHVNYDDEAVSLEQAVTRVLNQTDARLAADLQDADVDADVGEVEPTPGEVTPEGEVPPETVADLDEEPEDEAGVEIELGRSLLGRLRDHLADPEWCRVHEEDLRDIAKPATLIDGQHRALGAKACERGIPFSVVAMWNCPWAEQVFQFTVINYTSKSIPDQFITANAALSLTRTELETLRPRLVQARVKVVEYELMRVVNFDASSPFYGLVNLGERKNPSLIGYKTMVRLAKRWYDGREPFIKYVLLPNLYPDLHGRRNASQRLLRWQEADWGKFFIDFWKVVYDRYADHPSHEQGHTLWDVGHSNLIVAIVLYELQEAFIINCRGQDEEIFRTGPGDPEPQLRSKIRQRAERVCSYIPPEFFGIAWGFQGLSIGPGREALRTAIRQFIDNRGSYRYENSTLVTGSTA